MTFKNLPAPLRQLKPSIWKRTVRNIWRATVGLLVVHLCSADVPTSSSSDQQVFWVEEMASGLDNPWSMAWLPNGDLLITEKFGGVRRFSNGSLLPGTLTGGPSNVYQAGQTGLLDLALDPDFATNQRVFISYTEGDAKANRGAIYRARYTEAGLIDGETIFRVTPDSIKFPFPIAGRMQFLPDKTLLFTSSDDHDRRHLAQRLDNHVAKILRIDRNGKAPPDNPFAGRSDAAPEVFAYGTRAPLGIVHDPRDSIIWEVENGPQGGDELNVIKAGGNYGWPLATYGIEYTGETISDLQEAPGIETPAAYWSPSIAPSSITIYRGDAYPSWNGNLFVGTLRGKHLLRIALDGSTVAHQEKLLTDLDERIRDVRVGPDNLLYLLTDSPDGRLLRLRPGVPPESELKRVAKAPTVSPGFPMGPFPEPLSPPDVASGQALFEQQCMSCHAINAEQGSAGIGPHLAGLFGRTSGAMDGFQFSEALRDIDIVWNERTLDYFIASAESYVPGTTMRAAPIRDRQARHDLIGYLKEATSRE